MKSDDSINFTATKDYTRCDALCKRAGLSRGLMKRAFRSGRITRAGEPIKNFQPVKAGETIALAFADEETNTVPSPFRQRVLYEDADLLAVEKGVIPTMPCAQYPTGTLANEICGYFRTRGIRRKVRMLGRLDKETTGILVVAKNPYAYGKLASQHTESKRYIALCRGRIEKAGTIDAPIGPGDASLVREVRADGQRAMTRYRPVRRGDNTLVEIALETGRCHQIRCHMAHLGHPVVGDDLYGGGAGPMRLHVYTMAFLHPRDGRRIQLFSKIPQYFFNAPAGTCDLAQKGEK